MSREEERGRPSRKSANDADYYAEFTREEWIAYLAGRETPAYAGWADNFTATGESTGRQDAKGTEEEETQ